MKSVANINKFLLLSLSTDYFPQIYELFRTYGSGAILSYSSEHASAPEDGNDSGEVIMIFRSDDGHSDV